MKILVAGIKASLRFIKNQIHLGLQLRKIGN